MGRDQNDIAARVVARGAGLRLSPKAQVPALRAAIRRVLEEPGFRENAHRLADAIIEESRGSVAIQELEGLAAREVSV